MASREVSSKVMFKSGIWYTISNFLFKSIAFFTTPVFARVLTKSEYGEFNNLLSWLGIMLIFASCDLDTSIIRSKLDFEDDMDSYAFSVFVLEVLITIGLFIIFLCFKSFFVGLMEIDESYFYIIFVYMVFNHIYNIYITNERAHYRYKTFSLMTGLTLVIYSIFSVILVLIMDNKLDAMVYGRLLPYIPLGMCLIVLLYRKNVKFKLKYCKYGLMISLPLVPHVLSLILMGSADRIMITKYVGPQYTALYSISAIIVTITVVLLDSLNKAWAPWFLDTMKVQKRDNIKKIASFYIIGFLSLVIGILLLGPEVIYILGGEKYMSAVSVIPPLVIGCVFQFAYTMYVQVEFYEKKMRMIAIATMITAVINIALNYIFIPKYGYMAAGYTTLVSYMILFLLHYFTVSSLGYKDIFDRRIMFGSLFVSLTLLPLMVFLYQATLMRYCIIIIYGCVFLFTLYKKRKPILNFIRKK